ncbi:MAG: hypothetical protein IJ418_23895 [Clostridia bacterium]|nr:hypothetical protein [Clostridia bacterium]
MHRPAGSHLPPALFGRLCNAIPFIAFSNSVYCIQYAEKSQVSIGFSEDRRHQRRWRGELPSASMVLPGYAGIIFVIFSGAPRENPASN